MNQNWRFSASQRLEECFKRDTIISKYDTFCHFNPISIPFVSTEGRLFQIFNQLFR